METAEVVNVNRAIIRHPDSGRVLATVSHIGQDMHIDIRDKGPMSPSATRALGNGLAELADKLPSDGASASGDQGSDGGGAATA